MKKKNSHKRVRHVSKFTILGLCLALLISAELLFLGFTKSGSKQTFSQKDLEVYTQEVFDKCSSKDSQTTCYDEEVPKLMDFISMEDAFKVTFLLQEKDPSYRY